jgi:hypothetical protein
VRVSAAGYVYLGQGSGFGSLRRSAAELDSAELAESPKTRHESTRGLTGPSCQGADQVPGTM